MNPANDLPMQAPMREPTTIASPIGLLHLRPERPEDRDFRFDLFCKSRLPKWDLVPLDAAVRHQLMQMQFQAQTASYAAQFPNARFDIIDLQEKPIGRIVVDRPGDQIHIVDQAIVPELRARRRHRDRARADGRGRHGRHSRPADGRRFERSVAAALSAPRLPPHRRGGHVYANGVARRAASIIAAHASRLRQGRRRGVYSVMCSTSPSRPAQKLAARRGLIVDPQ
jgi:hypothetical protein